MEQQAGYSGQDVANVAYESPLGSFDRQVSAIIEDETPEITLELPELKLRQVIPNKDTPDNLPSIPKKLLLFPTWQIKSATKHIAEFTQTVSGFKLPDELQDKYKDELQTLGNVNKVLSRHHRELKEAQDAFNKTRGNKTLKDKNVACYVQEKRILDVLNTSSTEMLGVIISLVQLTGVEIKDIDQVAQLDIIIPNKIDDKLLKELKKRVYVKTIKFLIQTAAKIKGNEEVIGKHLQQQEELIQIEYYQRAQQIAAEFKKSIFCQIISEIISKENNRSVGTPDFVDYIFSILKPPEGASIREELDNFNVFSDNYSFISPKKILQFHQFNIERPIKRPDYQISHYYLSLINHWMEKYLLDKEQEVWKMIVENNPKLRKIYNLANKLIGNVNPELPDSMKEVVELLDYMTNKKNRWKEQRKIDKKEGSVKYKLESHYFSRTTADKGDADLFALNGNHIGNYNKLFPEETDGNRRAFRNLRTFILNSEGKIIFSYIGSIGELQPDGSRIAESIDGLLNLIDSEFKFILNDCDEIGDPDDEGNRNFRRENTLFKLDKDNKIVLLEEFENIHKRDSDGNEVAERINGKYILLDPNLRLALDDCDDILEPLDSQKDRFFIKEGFLFKRSISGEVILLVKCKKIEYYKQGAFVATKNNGQQIFISSSGQQVSMKDIKKAREDEISYLGD
jgi:hypothetical protein